MKYIDKKASPESLEEYKYTDGACFTGLPTIVKNDIRQALIAEQGYLCCYCNGEISLDPGKTVIEHFLPKDERMYPHLQLEYSNLLLSCKGGQDERHQIKKYPLYCDAKKKNKEIEVSPLYPECEDYFGYDEDGNIYGFTDAARKAIVSLGLNNEVLKNQRKAAIDSYMFVETRVDAEAVIGDLQVKNSAGAFLPYCVAVSKYLAFMYIN